MSKIFALVDCNNFYASCERLFEPSLEGKPVVVVSSVGGCALARSNEAKKLGILMGQPYFEWKSIAEKNNVKIFTPNFALYGDVSNRVMKTLAQFSDDYEIYSIDECFLDLTNMRINDLGEYGIKIKKEVKRVTGIPVSVGIASTKTLAKIANEMGKGNHKKILPSDKQAGCQTTGDSGVVDLTCINGLDEVLKNVSVEDVWGIGRQTATKLHIANIHTAYDFTKLDGEYIRKTYGIGFYHTWLELQGKQTQISHHTLISNKSIMCTRTFAKSTESENDLISHITQFASHAAEKLRSENLLAQYVTVFIRTNRFLERDKRYRGEYTISLTDTTSYTQDIVHGAIAALKKIYQKGFVYKKAGVILSGFSDENEKQLSIASKPKIDDEKRRKLMKAVDKLNFLHGEKTIHLGSHDTQSFASAEEKKQSLRSPRYTTKWNEIKKVK